MSSILEPFISIFEANNDFAKVSSLTFLDWALSNLLGLVTLVAGGNIIHFLFVGVLVKIPIIIISYFLSKPIFNGETVLPMLSPKILKKLIHYGSWMSLYGFGSMLFENGSRYLIGVFLSVADAGMFSLILSVFQRVHELLGSLGRGTISFVQ